VDFVGRRASESRKLLLAGILINLVLALAKIAGGLLGHSNALIADGIESSLDVLSSTMMWGAIKYAERPADTEHPYGHGKMESLAAVAGSLLLVAAGATLGFHSIRQIILLQGSTDVGAGPASFTLVVLLGAILLKEGLFRWVSLRAKAIESQALQTDAWHHRSDALTSLAAVVGISAALVGGPAWAQADAWAALFSCGLIIFNGVGMLRASIGEVLDAQAAPELIAEILIAVQAVPGVTSVEKCRVRKSGFARFADIHVRVSGDCTVREGHDIAHLVKNSLLKGNFHLADVVVHIEPEADDGSTSEPT
jgi:cation diffusion facilitator family transporter